MDLRFHHKEEARILLLQNNAKLTNKALEHAFRFLNALSLYHIYFLDQ